MQGDGGFGGRVMQGDGGFRGREMQVVGKRGLEWGNGGMMVDEVNVWSIYTRDKHKEEDTLQNGENNWNEIVIRVMNGERREKIN